MFMARTADIRCLKWNFECKFELVIIMVDDMTSKERIAGANTPAKSLSSSHPLVEVVMTSIPFVAVIACALMVVVVIILGLKRTRTGSGSSSTRRTKRRRMATESLVEMGGRSFFATSDAAEEHASEIEFKNPAISQHCRHVLEIVKVHSFVKIEKKTRGRQPKKKATLVAAEKEVYAFKCTICSVDDVERGVEKSERCPVAADELGNPLFLDMHRLESHCRSQGHKDKYGARGMTPPNTSANRTPMRRWVHNELSFQRMHVTNLHAQVAQVAHAIWFARI